MIEVFVESIRVNMTNYKRVVMLKEKTASRYLPIWIGHFEADAIAIPMQGMVESLNISVACAVTLFEAMRQRRIAGHYDTAKLDEGELDALAREWLLR